MGSCLLKKKKKKALRNIASETSASIANSMEELLEFLNANRSVFVAYDANVVIHEDTMLEHIALYREFSRSLKETRK